jgi:hypothetical protein
MNGKATWIALFAQEGFAMDKSFQDCPASVHIVVAVNIQDL